MQQTLKKIFFILKNSPKKNLVYLISFLFVTYFLEFLLKNNGIYFVDELLIVLMIIKSVGIVSIFLLLFIYSFFYKYWWQKLISFLALFLVGIIALLVLFFYMYIIANYFKAQKYFTNSTYCLNCDVVQEIKMENKQAKIYRYNVFMGGFSRRLVI